MLERLSHFQKHIPNYFMNKPHIKLDIKRQNDGNINFRYKTRNPGETIIATDNEEEVEEVVETPPDYRRQAGTFRQSLARLIDDAEARVNARNTELNVQQHLHYITINFLGQFIIDKFFIHWLQTYGLLAVNFTDFNSTVLFAIVDRTKANTLTGEISKFIQRELEGRTDLSFNRDITFIKDFKLHTTSEILHLETIRDYTLVKIHLADFPIPDSNREAIIRSLLQYLEQRGISYQLDEVTQVLNIRNTSPEQLTEIANNFDVILSVTSSLATVIRPSTFQQPERSYGFTVDASDADLPIIGIVDTGVSNLTPLRDALIDDLTFNVTSTSSFIDNANHGTGVAAFAALGKEPYNHAYRGTFKADAKILSIKVMDASQAPLPDSDVIKLLIEAKRKYPSIKIFVLSICYDKNKRDNEACSSYAYELDKFSHNNNCLIFICTSNNNEASVHNSDYDYAYYSNSVTNLATPSESMNNITIGAAADCLRAGTFFGISPSIEHPTLYSRKFHLDLTRFFSNQKLNKKLFKPDVIESGGDYEKAGTFIGQGENACLEVLSADPS